MEKKKYGSERVVAERYGISVSKLRSDRFLGKGLPYVKIGRLCRYDLLECDAIMEARKIHPGK